MPPRRDTFGGQAGVLHAGANAPPPPPPPPTGRQLPPDAAPVIPEEDQEASLEREIQNWRNKNVPLIDPAEEGAYWYSFLFLNF